MGGAGGNVLMIVADCLRYDSLCPSGEGPHLPNLRGLMSNGCCFQNAYAASSWTKTSVASLLTATFPVAHQAYAVSSTVPSGLPTLPEALRDNGYATVCITSNVYFVDRSGLERGFETVRFATDKDGKHINREFKEQIARLEGKKHFIYLHYMDAHLPYQIHDRRFGEEYRMVAEKYGRTTQREVEALGLSPFELSLLRELYLHEVEYLDSLIGEAVAELKDRRLFDRTMIVLTADHGSEFGEHSGVYHGYSLYEESIRVPLCIKGEGRASGAGKVARQVVRHVDVLPTILDYLEVEIPSGIHGQSLRPAIDGPEVAEAVERLVFSELLQFPFYRLEAVLDGGWKLIRKERVGYGLILAQLWRNLCDGNWYIFRSVLRGAKKVLKKLSRGRKRGGRTAGRFELYHLSDDPAEKVNLFSEEDEIARRLMEKLTLYRTDYQRYFADAGGTVGHDKELKERLKALGYMD